MKPNNKKPNSSKPSPAAPHVYRPQPVPKVLQQKMAPVQRKLPVAPPVYNPQTVPKVLQAKTLATGRPPVNPPRGATPVRTPKPSSAVHVKPGLQERRSAMAPALNRKPQTPTVAQAKRPVVQNAFNAARPDRPAGPLVPRPGQPLRTPGPLNATPRPGPPIGGASIQRKIKYHTSYRGRKAKNEKDLINQLVAAFGEPNRAKITGYVASMGSSGNWSMRDVWVYFNKLAASGSMPVHEHVEFAASRRAPSPRPLTDFSFTQVTWLTGIVGDRKFGPIRNSTDDDEHAEERFMARVESAHAEGHLNLKSNPRIVITLNNSPCREKCAGLLAAWVKKWRLTKVTIYFGNPYGATEEFTGAVGSLQGAKIRVHGIDLSRVPHKGEELTERASTALVKLGNDLRHAKAERWYESDKDSGSESGYESDESSGDDGDDEDEEELVVHAKAKAKAPASSALRPRSRSRSRDRSDERAKRRMRRSARSRSPVASSGAEGGGGGRRGRSRSPKRGSSKRPPRRAAAAAGGSGILSFPTWEEASYRRMRAGQRIRITNHEVDISDRIFELKIDFDPSHYAYPEVNRHVRWINQ